MKKLILIVSILSIVLLLSSCGNEKTQEETKALSADTVASSTIAEETIQSTFVETTSKGLIPPTKPSTSYLLPDNSEWTSDVFIVKEVNGTNLTLLKVIYGTDTEKLLYSCNYGELSGSADMIFNVGDAVTVVYGKEVMETYPIQLTIKEIYPATYN